MEFRAEGGLDAIFCSALKKLKLLHGRIRSCRMLASVTAVLDALISDMKNRLVAAPQNAEVVKAVMMLTKNIPLRHCRKP
jgi:hypothetical protein